MKEIIDRETLDKLIEQENYTDELMYSEKYQDEKFWNKYSKLIRLESDDKYLNESFKYWRFLNDSTYKNYYEVIKKATGKSELEIIVTKLYWLQEYMYRYKELFNSEESGYYDLYMRALEEAGNIEDEEDVDWDFVCNVLDNGRDPKYYN